MIMYAKRVKSGYIGYLYTKQGHLIKRSCGKTLSDAIEKLGHNDGGEWMNDIE